MLAWRVFLLVFLTCGCAQTRLSAQSNAQRPVANTISRKLTLDEATLVLHRHGYAQPYGLAWAKPGRDQSFRAFQIDDGVVLVIIFSDLDKSILSLSMLFSPPGLAKANDRAIDLRKITFESDGTYLLHLLKQGKPADGKAAPPMPQLPKPPLSKTNVNSKPTLTARDFHQAAFSKMSVVILVSHDGVYEGSDDDLELKLRKDGTVIVNEYGFGLKSTVGRYQVTNSGTVIIQPNGEPEWLPMPWSVEKELLVIQPPAKEVLWEQARKAGIPENQLTEEAYKESYDQWPLRQIQASKRVGSSRSN